MKRHFTLIEVSLSLVLLSFLLSGLFCLYSYFSKQKVLLDTLKWQAYEERIFQQRVERIFSSVKEPFFLNSDENSMLFLFDRGVTDEPLLSGVVTAKLYYDAKHSSMRLTVWPKPDKENPQRKPAENSLLFDRVTDVKFGYYCPPNLFKNDIDPSKIGEITPKEGWDIRWLSAYKKLPALIKITLKHKDKPIEYFFELPSVILYPKEKIET